MYNFKKLKQLRRKATNDENTNGRVVRDTGIQPKDPQTAIQEISSKTLGNYATKAGGDLARRSYKMGAKSMSKNEYDDKEDFRKVSNRQTGLAKAARKLVDKGRKMKGLTELSKYTLARYQMKAADDLRDRGVDQGASIGMKAAGMKPATDMKKNSKKMSKRVVGIGKAANKLTQKKEQYMGEEEESYAKIDSFHAHPDGKFTIGVKHKAGRFADEKKVMHTGSMQHLQKVTKKYPLTSRVSVHSVKTGRENIKEEHLIEDGHTDVASALRKCKTIMEDASDIHTKLAMMGTMDSLPSWWTNKLAVAAAYMDSMRDYLLYPTNEEVKDQKYLKKLKQTKDQATLGDMSTGLQKGGFQGRGMYEAKKVKIMKKVAKDKLIGKKDPFEPEPDITTQVIRTDSPDNVVK